MAVQTNYAASHEVGYPGMIADSGEVQIISRSVENAAMPFGSVAVQGTADAGVTLSAAEATNYIGIAVRDQSQAPDSVDAYPVGASAGILIEGAIWVTVSGAVAAGAAAYFVPATGAITATATNNVALPNAKFETSAADGALAVLRLR